MLLGLTQVKPGNYGINPSTSPRALTFAPNVTPGTYVETDDDVNEDSTSSLPSTAIFPPTEPAAAPTRRRLPPGKRLSQGYIPRPPNAFMLFRANFVRQKHVPGSIETNHGSLSKIIGNCWRALPLEEKKHWEMEAKRAKIAHREKWPNYRFRPVHNKNKKKAAETAANAFPIALDKRKDKLPVQPADEERCEVVAQLLLEGKKGEELAEAMRQIDLARQLSRPESVESYSQPPMSMPMPQFAQPTPLYLQRRPSSVPPPSTLYNAAHSIALPTLPFLVSPTPQVAYGVNPMFDPGYAMGSSSLHGSRAPSPVGNIARTRTFLGARRASSCQPIPSERMWNGYDPHPHPYSHQQQMYGMPEAMPQAWQLQPDFEPLPDVTGIFQPGWEDSFKDSAPQPAAFNPNMQACIPPDAPAPLQHPLHLNIGPLENYDFSSTPSTATDMYSAVTPGASGMYEPLDPHATWPVPESGPSSAFSGSPAHSDASLPTVMQHPSPPLSVDSQATLVMCAPQPQHAQYDAWGAEADKMHMPVMHGQGEEQPMAAYGDESYAQYDNASQYDMYGDVGMDVDMGMSQVDYGYQQHEY